MRKEYDFSKGKRRAVIAAAPGKTREHLACQPDRLEQGSGATETSIVSLRLQTSLLEEARRVAEAEGMALNQFINVAVAEKLSALRTDDYFRERAARGNVQRAKRVLKRAGRCVPVTAGDEINRG